MRRSRKKAASSLVHNKLAEKVQPFGEPTHIDLKDTSIDMEKPQKAVLAPSIPSDPQVGWAPQIRTHYGVPVVAKPAMSDKPSFGSLRAWEKSSSEYSLKGQQTPPPSYYIANGGESASPRTFNIPPPPPQPTAVPPLPPTPRTPPASSQMKSHFSIVSVPDPDANALMSPARSESFAARDIAFPTSNRDSVESTGSDGERDNQKLPRLMSVSATFTPTLDDELSVKIGDTVRMLEEYQDGWCLAQRVGRHDAPRGVCPRFCLQERKVIVPATSTRRFSPGSLSGQVSGWR